jgi:hypothetical protein
LQPNVEVMRPERLMRSITTAFAEAMAAGDLDAAEGWFRLARMTAERTRGAGGPRRIGRFGAVPPPQPVGRSDDRVIIALP